MIEYLKITEPMGTLLAAALRDQVRSHWMGPNGNRRFAQILVNCFPSFVTEQEPELEAGRLLMFQWTETPK